MKMKKLTALLLASLMAVSMAACGDTPASGDGTGSSDATLPAAVKKAAATLPTAARRAAPALPTAARRAAPMPRTAAKKLPVPMAAATLPDRQKASLLQWKAS